VLSLDILLATARDGAPVWPAAWRRRIAGHEAGHAIAGLAKAQ
jgi:hypothetical protein